MGESTTFVILTVLAIGCGGFSAYIAGEKGYSAGAWFFAGLLFNIIALIAAAGLPMKPSLLQALQATSTTISASPKTETQNWSCPKCGKPQPGWSTECECGFHK